MRVKFASKAKTLKGFVEEIRQSHKVFESPVPFEITGPDKGQVSGVQSRWHDAETAREFRPRVRQIIPPALLQKLEAVDAWRFFDVSFLGMGSDTLIAYVFERRPQEMTSVYLYAATPNCGFDKSFGYPCSAEQEQA